MNRTTTSPAPGGTHKPKAKKDLTYKPPGNSFVTFVRCWISFVALMALANTIQCFMYPNFVWEKLYNAPEAGASPLTARTYGLWTALAAAVRFLYAYNIYNWEMFLCTLVTFLVALAHFLSEVLFYHTSLADMGMFTPIIVSGVSLLLMLFSIPYIWPALTDEEIVDIRNFPKVKKPTTKLP